MFTLVFFTNPPGREEDLRAKLNRHPRGQSFLACPKRYSVELVPVSTSVQASL